MTSFGKHYQVIFENSPQGMFILDFQGRFLLFNEAVRHLFDKSDDELKGTSLFTLCTADDIKEFPKKFQALVLQPNSHLEDECRFLQGNNSKWIRIRLHHVGKGAFSPFIFGILEDITRNKRGEERLLRQKEEAEKATQIKSAFLANMSHEIRTPIHTITGMTELLLETRLDEEQKEYATQVKYAAEVLIGLINDILDFSKIEAGKLPLEIIQCDLISLVEEAVEMVSLLAHKKGLEIIIDIAKDVPSWVLGDPVRIRQILINLINNAVKFTQQGEILIRVRVISVEGEIYRIRFEVIDTGIGIPEDKQSILFAPFTQVDFSTTRKFGGTGLGLSISKSLVEMMNGTIGVTSKLGAGSNFNFMIPLERVLDHEEEVEIIVDEVHAKRPVLVVENNEHVWQVLYYHLTDWFERVDWARTGQAALERLKRSSEKPYGLVLVDQRLPEMDGWQFASEVRNTSLTVSPSLILMSPLGFGTEAKMKLLGWFSGYLDKPITRKKLLECIGSVLYGTETIQESDKIHLEKVEEASWIGKRILVAEDHLVNQQLFKTILEKFGLTVILAENGLAAVEVIEKNPVDLVFMDVQMPIMNGYEASILIRQRGYRVPIVAVTANAVKGEREKCIETGMDDYLTKPFKSKDLIPYLQKHLRSGRAGEEDVSGIDEIEEAELLTTDLEEISASLVQPDTEVFNYPAAVETFLGKADVVMRVVQAFREKVLDQLHEMQVALDNENWDTLTVISHGIKGGAWNLEAKRLGDAAARLEQASKNKERQRAMESLRDIEREFRAFERFLDQQLKLPAKE